MSYYGGQQFDDFIRVTTKEDAAFQFISGMCRDYDYFDDRWEENADEERIIMSDHDIEAYPDYSHTVKVTLCNFLKKIGIINRHMEDDGFFICKRNVFIKYVVGHMATRAWPKKELLEYVNHYCCKMRQTQMGKMMMEAGQSLPVRSMHGACKALEGSSYQIAHVPHKVKNVFPPAFPHLHLLPLTLREKATMSAEERAHYRDEAIRLWSGSLMWKQGFMDEANENGVDTKFVLLRKKVTYEIVSTINDVDHLQSLVGAVERSPKKRPLCDVEELE